jgi:MFS family permease
MTRHDISRSRANVLLVLLMLAYMVSFIDRQILSLMVGPIREDLAISDFQISLLQGASFVIFYTTLGMPLGWLADRYRRTTIVGVGAIVWSLATAASGLVRSFGGLFGARIVVGAGEAALSPAAFSLLADVFPAQRLARAIGIFTLAIPLGAGLGFIISGTIIASISELGPVHWPIIGAVQPWQTVFLVVGLPGALLGLTLLCMREPARRASVNQTTGEDASPPFGWAVAQVWRRRVTYRPIFTSLTFLSIAGYAMLNWYPTFLIRRYGLNIGQVGLLVGCLYIVCGIVGTIGAPLVSEFLLKRGHTDANLRTVMWVGLVLAPCAVIGTLVGDLRLAVLIALPAVVMLNAGYGVASAELQIVTPNRMRGVTSALLLLCSNLAGLALGSSLVPIVTDFVFQNDQMVGYSVAIIVGPSAALAAWSASKGLVPRSNPAALASAKQ